VFRPDEQRYRVAERIDRLNDLGFDVDEIELITTAEGTRLQGAHPRRPRRAATARSCSRSTGLQVTENQARRLLNDMRSYRAHLEQREGRPVPETVAAHRWRAEVYDRVMAMVPVELSDRLAPAEVFHEIWNTAGSCPRRRARTSAPPLPRAPTCPGSCPAPRRP
jgi:DNA-binding transcriptional MerR regulator